MLEWKLRQQQRQSEEDSRWLAEEESHLVKWDTVFFFFTYLFSRGFSRNSFVYFDSEKEIVCCS